jgi:hypothetical protein
MLDGFDCGSKIIKDTVTDRRRIKDTATLGTVRVSHDEVRSFGFSNLRLTGTHLWILICTDNYID